jgi:DNA-binding XRE family transcriptional regulator
MSKRRKYIRENGRVQYREMCHRKSPSEEIHLQGVKIGYIHRYWSSVYCTWVWEAQLHYQGRIYSNVDTESKEKMINWAKKKIKALRDPVFPQTLSRLIHRSDYTQEDLADLCGITKGAIAKWISGQSLPSITSLVRISRLICEDWENQYLILSEMVELER